MLKKLEFNSKKYFEDKNYLECIKTCLQAISINPNSKWIYDLLGYSYMHLGMFSQSRGCFAVANNLTPDKNYEKLIQLTEEKENESRLKSNHNK